MSPNLKVVHISVEIEGSVYNHVLEADPNLKYTFTWDKRNVYKQKVGFYFFKNLYLVIALKYKVDLKIIIFFFRFMELQKQKFQLDMSTKLVIKLSGKFK